MQRMLMTVAAVALAALSQSARAEQFTAKFSGFQEVGALNNETGAVLTDGTATLALDLDRSAQTIAYTLTFSNLTTPVTQSHIHFGQRHVPGGIMVFFCTNLGNGPAGTPACPASGGTVSGTITPASVVAITGQNVTAGDFDAVTDALMNNTAYGNIHTTKFPAGEIRGQIRLVREHKDDDHRGGDDHGMH